MVEATYTPDVLVFEQVSAMPKQGVTSSFRFGQATGMLQASLEVMYPDAALVEITPAVWKKGMGLSSSKAASMDAATRMWPKFFTGRPKADDGIAEAALMAYYWHQRGKGEG